jgi:Sigma-70, region 4
MARMEKTLVLEAEATTTGMDDELAICTCVHDVIPALKAEQAELVRRVELGGEPLHQVATDLGITPNNASVRLHRARRSLREGRGTWLSGLRLSSSGTSIVAVCLAFAGTLRATRLPPSCETLSAYPSIYLW